MKVVWRGVGHGELHPYYFRDHERYLETKGLAKIVHTRGAPHVQNPKPVASNDVLCWLRDACLVAVVVGMWRVPAVSVVDAAVTLCWTADRDTSIHCPPPPSSRDGGVTDSSKTSSGSSRPMSNNERNDAPLHGAGNGHTDDKLRRPR